MLEIRVEGFCKNHSGVEAGYFLADQPWQKYCSNCALNVALCGKKIEKQLNGFQFQRKVILTTISNQLKSTIQLYNFQNNNLGEFLGRAEQQFTLVFNSKIKAIDELINKLMEVRDSLFKIYQGQISRKLDHYLEKQNTGIVSSHEIKKQLQFIQRNFTQLIQIDKSASNQFQQKNKLWESLIHSTTQLLPSQEELQQIYSQFKQTQLIFDQKYATIQPMMVGKQQRKMSKTQKTHKTEPQSDYKNHSRVLQDSNRRQNQSFGPKIISSRPTQISIDIITMEKCYRGPTAQLKLRSPSRKTIENKKSLQWISGSATRRPKKSVNRIVSQNKNK